MRSAVGAAFRTAIAAGVVCALAGLVEGFLLAIVYDPFEADWTSRVASLAAFVSAYAAAGLAAGVVLGLAIHLIFPGLAARRGVAAALVCWAIGAAYAGAWRSPLQRILDLPPAVAVSSAALVTLAFASGGLAAGRLIPPPHRRRRSFGVAALLVAVFPLLAVSRPAVESRPAGVPAAGARPAATEAPGAAPRAAARNVLIILADTLRADHMSLYGYPRPTSPRLSDLSAAGVTFTQAIVQKTKTSPSVASLLTGTYPHTHGIVNCRTSLPDGSVTLAELLRERGFATHSIVANANVGAGFNFDQGFEAVDEIWADRAGSDARAVTDHAIAWLRRLASVENPRRFFLYAHYIDPHVPYAPPAPETDRFVDDAHYGRFAHIEVGPGNDAVGSIRPSALLPERPTEVDFYVARYDAEIAWLDRHVGRLIDGLRELGLDRETLVVFTSDHGEALGEHEVYFSHGAFLYEDNVRVPLILALPGTLPAGRRVETVTEVSGVAPTVMEALGLPPFAAMESPGFWTDASRPPGSTGGEAAALVEAGSKATRLRTAIRTGRWKLIENPDGFDRTRGLFDLRSALSIRLKRKALELMIRKRDYMGRLELYDVTEDPGETRNLALKRPDIVKGLHPRLRAWREAGADRARLTATPDEEIPEELRRNLESLGYVH